MWRNLLAITLTLMVSVACTTTTNPPPYLDKTPIEVTGIVKEFCAGCELLHGEAFTLEGGSTPLAGDMSWTEDIIEILIVSPDQYKGKILEVRNETGNKISELWKKEGSAITFLVEKQFLESPYTTRGETHEITTYVNQEMEDSLKTAHIKSVLTTPEAAPPTS